MSNEAIRRLAWFCSICAALVCMRAGADTFDVTDDAFNPFARENLDPKDPFFDDARRFRLAYRAAAKAGGGTIYVPAGKPFRFESADPADPEGETHVVIRHPAIRIAGDARGGGAAGPDYGSVIVSTSAHMTVFKIACIQNDPITGGTRAANGTTFENLHITRAAPAQAMAGIAPTAIGIAFDSLFQSEVFLYRTAIRNCRIENHFDGVRSWRRSGKRAARPTMFTIEHSEISGNSNCGVNLQDWGGIVCVGSFFQDNGCDGLRAFAYRPLWGGTLDISACGFANNGQFGVRLRRYNTIVKKQNWSPRDVHISSTQVDMNGAGAFYAMGIANINVSSSSFTANGWGETFADQAAVDISGCTDVAFAGVTFDGNNASALMLEDVVAASVSGCNFTWNNMNASEKGSGSHHAVVIDGGRQIVFGACVFQGSLTGSQNRGVLFRNNPQGVFFTGISFERGLDAAFEYESLPEGASVSGIRAEYMNGNGLFRIWPPANAP